MPRIGKYPFFGKRFFRQARKLIGSCHFAHFWRLVMAIAALHGRRSLSRLREAIQDGEGRTRQAISHFLTHAEWDAPGIAAADRAGHVAAVGLEGRRHAVRDPRRHPETQARQTHGCRLQAVSARRKGLREGAHDCRLRVGLPRRGDSLCGAAVGEQGVLRGAAEIVPGRIAREIPQIDGTGGRHGGRSVAAIAGQT